LGPDFLQGQAQALAHAIQAAHPADPPQHLRGIQALAAFAFNQAGVGQGIEHRLKSQGAQILLQQALAEVNQRGGMELLLAQLAVERQVPPRVVAQQLHRLPVGNVLQVLQQAHPEQDHGLNGDAPVLGAVAALQLGARPDQFRVHFLGQQAVAVRGAKELAGQRGGGEELSLGRVLWQAHTALRKFSDDIGYLLE
jgi:hypothetical protein